MTSPLADFTARLEQITATHAAATTGPWFWWGNTDTHAAALAGHGAHGVTEIITTTSVERDPNGPDAERMRASMAEHGWEATDIEAYVQAWAADPEGTAREDHRLALSDRNGWLKTVEEAAVYTVARKAGLPDDTPRDDPAVYRADICDVRDSPNGDFLRQSWEYVKWMSEALTRVAALAGEEHLDRAKLIEALTGQPDT